VTNQTKLSLVKLLHTAVWLFFNVVIFYLLWAVISGKIDKWIWIGFGLILAEVLVLVVFKKICPITIIARKYSDSKRDNFDIFLPEWLAHYNKMIYSAIVLIIMLILIYRLTG
jgi:hypothetical protein